jgi:hypothetical protein
MADDSNRSNFSNGPACGFGAIPAGSGRAESIKLSSPSSEITTGSFSSLGPSLEFVEVVEAVAGLMAEGAGEAVGVWAQILIVKVLEMQSATSAQGNIVLKCIDGEYSPPVEVSGLTLLIALLTAW